MAPYEESDEPLTVERAVETLRWWREASIDISLDDTSHDRFAEFLVNPAPVRRAETREATVAPLPPAAAPIDRPARTPVSTAVDEAARSAREIAAAARTLDELREALERFEGCGLKSTATRLVFADGAPGSAVMLVGEAPGGDEDRIGRPFVGRAGQLLDRMLASIGLDRNGVYIANCVPWRPPGNRTPTSQESQICLPFIRRQIELSAPKLIVCLGGSALTTLLGGRVGISRARGQWQGYASDSGVDVPTLPMFHPAYLLRQPSAKRWAWADLRRLKKAIDAGYRPV